MTRGALHLLCLSAAFWVALALRERRASGESARRFVAGLALGGALAHLGWAALYIDRVWTQPSAVVSPAGFCVLFVPLGLLALAPWRAPRAERDRFLAGAFASLPLALATARLGCLVTGCCRGLPTDLPWGLRLAGDTIPRHPTALYDIAGLLALHAAARALPEARVAPAVLIGFGALRLAIEPLRIAPPLGPPVVPAGLLAAAWIGAGVAILLCSARSANRIDLELEPWMRPSSG